MVEDDALYPEDEDVRTLMDAVAWSPDGTLLAVASGDYSGLQEPSNLWVWVINIETGQVIFTTTHHGWAKLVWYPTGEELLIVSGREILERYNVSTGTLEAVLTGRGLPPWYRIEGISLSPDGSRIAGVFTRLASSDPQEFTLYDGQTLQPMLSVNVNFTMALSWVGYSPDGSILATVGYDGIARIWDADTLTLQSELAVSPGQRLYGGAWSNDSLLAVGGEGPQITIWNVDTEQIVGTLPARGGLLRWHPDGRQLAVGSSIWDTLPDKGLWRLF